MTDERIKKIYKNAYTTALLWRKNVQDAEDIAQEVLLRFIQTKPGQTTTQAVVDIFRRDFYDPRRKGEGRRVKSGHIPIHPFGRENASQEHLGLLLDDLKKILNKEQYEIVLLRMAGYELKEIGRVFGCGESAMSQRLSLIGKKLTLL